MISLETQIRQLAEFADEVMPWIDPADIQNPVTVRELPPGRVRVRVPTRPWIGIVVAALAIVVIASLSLLLSGGVDEEPPASNPPVVTTTGIESWPTTTLEAGPSTTVAPVNPVELTDNLTFTWSFAEGVPPYVDSAGNIQSGARLLGYNEHGFFATSWDGGPSESLWNSPDGTHWTRLAIGDTRLAGWFHFIGGDLIYEERVTVLDRRTPVAGNGSRLSISHDGVEWTVLGINTAEHLCLDCIRFDVTDSSFLVDFIEPDGWDDARPGTILETTDGYLGLSFNRERLRLSGISGSPIQQASSPDLVTWTPAVTTPFEDAGYHIADGSLRSAFAARTGIVLAALSNGDATALWRTTEGMEWDQLTTLTPTSGGIWDAGDFFVQGLEFLRGYGEGPTFHLSADGTDWLPITIPNSVLSGSPDAKASIGVAGNTIVVFYSSGEVLVGTPERERP